MNKTIPLLILVSFLFNACSKPTATVFEDNRLMEEEEIKICLIGDLGRDTPHQKEMAEAMEREACHRIFFLGDLVYPKGIKSVDDPELQQRFLSYYLPLLESSPNLEINLVLGNHDHKGDPAAWKKVSEVYPGFFFPNYYYMIDYGGLCMVALDTSFYYYTKEIVEAFEQASWLTKLDSRLKDCEVKVAVTHHPLKGGGYPGSMDWNGSSGPLKAFLETFVIGRMDMHISGHVHVLEDDGKDDGTRLLISGTGGEILGGGKPGYVVLRWNRENPKSISYTMKRIDLEVEVFEDSEMQKEEYHEGELEHIIHKNKLEKDSRLFRLFNFTSPAK